VQRLLTRKHYHKNTNEIYSEYCTQCELGQSWMLGRSANAFQAGSAWTCYFAKQQQQWSK